MGIAGSVGAAYFACHPGRKTMWHVEASELGKVAARDHVHLVGETGLHKSINHLGFVGSYRGPLDPCEQ